MEDNLKRILNKFANIYNKDLQNEAETPRYRSTGPDTPDFQDSELEAIEKNFHDLMWYRCRNSKNCQEWLHDNESVLPTISNILLTSSSPEWFAIPGMYGGFSYALVSTNGAPALLTESWIRVVGGSGERHIITPSQVILIGAGFV